MWLNSIVLLLVSLGDVVFLYGLSRELRKVGEVGREVAAMVNEATREAKESSERIAELLASSRRS